MQELTLTRHNELIDPGLSIWAWQIPVYLFLGGLVAGLMILWGGQTVRGQPERPTSAGPWLPFLGLALLSVGMGALFLDLEHPWYVWRLYTTFQVSSPMSWGAWILLLIYPVLAAAALVRLPATVRERLPILSTAAAWIVARPPLVRRVGWLSIGLGAALGMYTGILLSSLGARPLWNSAILWLLFLVSGLSAAAALVHLITRDAEEREQFGRVDTALLGLELVVVAAFILGMLGTSRVHLAAIHLLLDGAFAPAFWVLALGLGVVMPLLLQVLAAAHRIRHSAVAPVLVLLGGLALRFVIVLAGQASHWS